MKYYTMMPKFNRRDRKAGLDRELNDKLTALDRAILKKTSQSRGEDIFGIINVCKPYTNQHGGKQFASVPTIKGAVRKLKELGLLVEK
jgi:hypothetical protein